MRRRPRDPLLEWDWTLQGDRYVPYDFPFKRQDLPVVEEDTKERKVFRNNGKEEYCSNDESRTKSSQSRSPIKQITREPVEEARPVKNFGDYDPVRYIPPQRFYTGVKSNLTGMQRKRKVIYAGLPSENELRSRLKTWQNETHYSDMDTQMKQEKYEQDDLHFEDTEIIDLTDDHEEGNRAYQQQSRNATSSNRNSTYQQYQPESVQQSFQNYGNVRNDNPNDDIASHLMGRRWQTFQTGTSSVNLATPSASRNYEREPFQLNTFGRTIPGQVGSKDVKASERSFVQPQTSPYLPSHSRSGGVRYTPDIRARPISTQTRDENYRVAIPRDPCIMLESERSRRRGFRYDF